MSFFVTLTLVTRRVPILTTGWRYGTTSWRNDRKPDRWNESETCSTKKVKCSQADKSGGREAQIRGRAGVTGYTQRNRQHLCLQRKKTASAGGMRNEQEQFQNRLKRYNDGTFSTVSSYYCIIYMSKRSSINLQPIWATGRVRSVGQCNFSKSYRKYGKHIILNVKSCECSWLVFF